MGIIGKSGSGKSTLGISLIRLQRVTDDESHFRVQRIDQQDKNSVWPLRTDLQVVLQDLFSSLNSRMIIRQIIGANSEEREQLIPAVLIDVHMGPEVMNRFLNGFSGDLRQRISIVKALVVRPKFMILDEPTSSLDLLVQAQIIDLLRELRSKHDPSDLFISHDLTVVRSLCHNIIVLQAGNLVERGPTGAVLKNQRTKCTGRLVDASLNTMSVRMN